MGFETSNRKQYFPPHWAKIRRLVLARADYKCEHIRADTGLPCGAYANQCDHINHGENGVYDDSLDNLQALCEYHHTVKSKSEGGLARAQYRAKRVLDSRYSHPAFH